MRLNEDRRQIVTGGNKLNSGLESQGRFQGAALRKNTKPSPIWVLTCMRRVPRMDGLFIQPVHFSQGEHHVNHCFKQPCKLFFVRRPASHGPAWHRRTAGTCESKTVGRTAAVVGPACHGGWVSGRGFGFRRRDGGSRAAGGLNPRSASQLGGGSAARVSSYCHGPTV